MVIDVEPDGFFINRFQPEPWKGYENAVDFLNSVREKILDRTGSPAVYSWAFRIDSQIGDTYGRADWALVHYADAFERFKKSGDALGLHVHAYRWGEAEGQWISDFGNPAWIGKVVRSAMEAFRKTAGRPCDFFRFGERWMSDTALALLDGLGVPYDLSLEPGHESVPAFHPEMPHTGSIPDQREVPTRPYRPSREDFRRPDAAKTSGLFEIPLTTGEIKPRIRFWKKPRIETANLYLLPDIIVRLVREALSRPNPYLALVVRTDVFSREDYFGNFKQSLEYLLNHTLVHRFVFASPAEAARILTGAVHGKLKQ